MTMPNVVNSLPSQPDDITIAISLPATRCRPAPAWSARNPQERQLSRDWGRVAMAAGAPRGQCDPIRRLLDRLRHLFGCFPNAAIPILLSDPASAPSSPLIHCLLNDHRSICKV